MMRIVAEMSTRLFEKLAELRKAALLRTKPTPINITDAPADEATIKGRETSD